MVVAFSIIICRMDIILLWFGYYKMRTISIIFCITISTNISVRRADLNINSSCPYDSFFDQIGVRLSFK
ncbi:hypothetical protein NADFUDRAFT_80900 [Nadsonia fulvescens var. elongata DSM 6958]|uniref:Uncharacterized protein n=1 Tax=Nadsonia fulvescens var. elongata DSM 6958 TaxID=857566 RepID=A0A1E3PQL2_9ASCO|nr:hypothetical protein NADFUDRAFT_80900 [Nadsonia fulvescens var. elongata DSM 6958]